MKKLNLCIIVILLMVGLFSCKKDTIEQQQTQEDELMMRSKKVVALIKQFDLKMENTLKSDEAITLDSAIWNLEASLNYNYADPEEAIGEYSFSKSNYTLEVDANGGVKMGDVQTVYSQMEQDLGNNFKSGDETVVIFSDVAIDSIMGGTAYLSGTNGYSSGIPRNYVPIDDDWVWGTLDYNVFAGNCTGTDMTSDGANELEWRLNNPLPVSQVPVYGYTDIEVRQASPIDADYIEVIYLDPTGTEEACIINEQLTFYLNQADMILYSYIGQGGERPNGLDLISVRVEPDFIGGPNTPYFHTYIIRYGIPLLVPPSN